MSYVFDTNAFNRFLDDTKFDLTGISIIATHVQLSEIRTTKDENRRNALLDVFKEITNKIVHTESMIFPLVFGVQKFGDGTHEKLLEDLNSEVRHLNNKNRKKKEKGHPNDAQIAEVALKNQYVLVTDDSQVIQVFLKYGGEVLNYEDFKEKHT